jgi:hypothetical protein
MPLSTARFSLPWATSTVCATHRFGQEATDEVPLLVREVHGNESPFGLLTFR